MSVPCRREILKIKPYVPGKPISEVKAELGLANVIKLASNENPLGPSKKAIEAMGEAIKQSHIYPDGNCTSLREVVANKLGVNTNQLIFGNGSDEVLKLVGEAYLQPGDEVILADPTFSEYQFVARLMGASERLVPLKNFAHNLEAMAEQVNNNTKIIFVCNPNNPTGTMVNHDKLSEFLHQIPQEVLVVIDEAYFEYVTDSHYPRSLEFIEEGLNVIVTRTYSKVYGLAALRIGYGIAKPEIINALNRVKEPFNVNGIAQIAAEASELDDEHVKQSIQVNQTGKTYLYTQLESMGLNFIPTHTNFILIDVACEARKVFRQLLAKGVIVRAADIFGLSNFIRVTIGTMEQNQRFIAALKEVLAGENRH